MIYPAVALKLIFNFIAKKLLVSSSDRPGFAGRRSSMSLLLSRRIFRALFLILFAGSSWFQALAESTEFSLRGKVLDPNQAPIAGAQITATLDGSPSSFSTVSNQFGEFSLALKPGHYMLKVFAPGFQETSQAVDVTPTGSEFVEVGLQVSAPHDTITVIATDYLALTTSSATKTLTQLRDIPQSISVVTREQIRDQQMLSLGDAVRYVPGVTVHQGENNRDQIIFRGNSSSADFFLNGVRDDVQYYRDLYNLDGVEVLRGPNAMIFGRGGGELLRAHARTKTTPVHHPAGRRLRQ